jgi:hypothetical protein
MRYNLPNLPEEVELCEGFFGENTQAMGLTLVCENSEFICEKNCLFLGGVWVQSSNQHGLIDLASGEILNSSFSSVILENHVWIGRNVTLLSKAYIGKSSIIGSNAVVTNKIQSYSIAVGIPAKVVKENITWSRYLNKQDEFSIEDIQNFTENL